LLLFGRVGSNNLYICLILLVNMRKGLIVCLCLILILSVGVVSAGILEDSEVTNQDIFNYGEKSYCVEGINDGELTCTMYKGDKYYPEWYSEQTSPIVLELDNEPLQSENVLFIINLIGEDGERVGYTDRIEISKKISFYARDEDNVEKLNIYLKEINLEEDYVVFYLFEGEEACGFDSSPEKNLIAKGFNIVRAKDSSGVDVLLDYEERGLSVEDLCGEDNYLAIFSYSVDGGNSFEIISWTSRGALKLSGPTVNFLQMLRYKVTFKHLIMKCRMDYVPEGSTDIDVEDNSIKETNEGDNCIQQEFKVSLFKRKIVSINSAVTCTD